jgi:hypothetical protein
MLDLWEIDKDETNVKPTHIQMVIHIKILNIMGILEDNPGEITGKN